MCNQTKLREQAMREFAIEFRKWFRKWRRRENGKRALAYSHWDKHRQTDPDILLSVIANRDCS